jgi:hypothetical protein
VVVNLGLAAALAVLWVGMAVQGRFWQADFTMFYTGWTIVLDGQGHQLYDLDVQTAYQHALAPGRAGQGGLLPFNYPPTVALLVPLAFLPLDAAFYAWAAVQAGLVVVLLRQLFDLLGEAHREQRLAVAAAVLGFPALFVTFQMGQLSLLVTVCLLGLVREIERGRPLPAALWFVLGTVKPQLIVVPAVVLLAARRWRVLGVASALFAAWAGLAALVLGPACWPDFLRLVALSSRQFGTYGIFPERMYNLKAPLVGMLGAEHLALINAVSLAAFAAVLVLVFVLWCGRWPKANFRLRLALCLQLGLLTNLHFNPADAVAFVVPAALFWGALPRGTPASRILGVVLIACPLVFLVDCFARPDWPGGVRPFFVVMAALAGAMAWAFAVGLPVRSALEDTGGEGTIPSISDSPRGCPTDEYSTA